MESVTPEFVVIETLGSHGRVHTRVRVELAEGKRHVTIGRSVEADVILDDAYAAALHVSVEVTADGNLLATDLGSANGIGVAGQRHIGAQKLPLPGGSLQVGRTRLRIRAWNENLAPEKLDRAAIAVVRGSPSWFAAVGALVCAAYVAYSVWLEAPRDMAPVIVVAFIPVLLAAGVWITLWALLSRLMQGEWRWLWHSAILFSVSAVYVLADALLDIAWFAFSLPRWESRDILMIAGAFAFALYWHNIHASGISGRRAAIIAVLLPASVSGVALWIQSQVQERDVNHIGVTEKFYPPALRVRQGGDIRDFFEQVALLKAAADSRRSSIPPDDVSNF